MVRQDRRLAVAVLRDPRAVTIVRAALAGGSAADLLLQAGKGRKAPDLERAGLRALLALRPARGLLVELEDRFASAGLARPLAAVQACLDLRNALVVAHAGLVGRAVSWAWNRVGLQGVCREDLEQEAHRVLMRAVDNFRPGPASFGTYAWLGLQGALVDASRDQRETIALPGEVRTQLSRVKRAKHACQQRLAAEPGSETLAEATGLERTEVDHLLALGCTPVSLDSTPQAEGGVPLRELLPASLPEPEAAWLPTSSDLRPALHQALNASVPDPKVRAQLLERLEDGKRAEARINFGEARALEALRQDPELRRLWALIA